MLAEDTKGTLIPFTGKSMIRSEIGGAIAGMRTTLYVSLSVGLVILLIAAVIGLRAARAA